MIRQLGPASLFCSFSSAETKWNRLLRILGNLIDHKNYSEELKNLTWDDRCRLIQSDPVTCARHFDFQFNTFLKDVLTSELALLAKVKEGFIESSTNNKAHLVRKYLSRTIQKLYFIQNNLKNSYMCCGHVMTLIMLNIYEIIITYPTLPLNNYSVINLF